MRAPRCLLCCTKLEILADPAGIRTFELDDIGSCVVSERVDRLRSHQRNIDRYQGLLKSSLSDVELRFVEQRLSEERLALAVLQFMSPGNSSKNDEDPGALK
jgi:hypothetical protein